MKPKTIEERLALLERRQGEHKAQIDALSTTVVGLDALFKELKAERRRQARRGQG